MPKLKICSKLTGIIGLRSVAEESEERDADFPSLASSFEQRSEFTATNAADSQIESMLADWTKSYCRRPIELAYPSSKEMAVRAVTDSNYSTSEHLKDAALL